MPDLRFKHVPAPPDSVDVVFEARRAVPLVPDTQDDCCTRLMERVGFPDRDEAAKWLTFLRALDLVAKHEAGYARTREDVPASALADRFLDGVYLAPEVRDAVATATATETATEEDGDDDRSGATVAADRAGATVAEVFDAVADDVPGYERHKHPESWREVWRGIVERELDWLVLLGELDRTDDGGYVPATGT
jgi:hypothetical protein